jgi:murein DD-endopeptidase MepM/ murein hydrolase activator NlpD
MKNRMINLSKYKKLMPKFLTIAVAFVFFSSILSAQSDTISGFRSPLAIPLFLAGNYGELRSDHFHAGLDLKTMGEIGKPVYAAQSGYVSRIRIQTGGYGRAIYIRHANGLTTVYGHLDRFLPDVQNYVTNYQYDKHSYEVDIYPPKNLFIVNRGQQIAISGNTGYSGGPHVHFEIRKNDGEVPLNGLRFGLPIIDNQSPEFKNLVVYSIIGDQSVGNNGEIRKEYTTLKQNDTSYTIKGIIEGYNESIGFASEVYDYMNGSTNPLGIYSLELRIDGNFLFSFMLDNISFTQSSYVDAHMDYDLYINEDKSVHRLFKLPNNNLPIYTIPNGNGIYHFRDDSIHKAEIIASDAFGNISILKFSFRKKSETQNQIVNRESDNYVRWDRGKSFENGKFRIFIPSDALYRDIFFNFSITSDRDLFKDTFYVYSDNEPLSKSISLQLMIDSVKENLKDKILFVRLKKNNRISAENSEWLDGKLTAFTKNFGIYVIRADTVPPKIVPVNFTNNKQYFEGQELTFRVTDDLSGLKMWNAYINEQWILTEYDPKSDIVTYTIDKKRLKKGKPCVLKIFAMDQKNNISVFEGKFIY